MESVVNGLRVGVLGVTVGVVAGLLTVALCHYLCVAFGVQKNAEAGENEAPVRMVCSGGTSVIKDLGRCVLDRARSGRVTSVSFLFLELWRIRKPYSKSSLDTLLGVMKVGSLLHRYLSSHFGVDYDGWNPGPKRGATWRPILVHVAFQVDPLAQPGTVTLYLGANRGRGQTYPNGDIANGVAARSEAVGMCPRSSPRRMLPNIGSLQSVERNLSVVRISVLLVAGLLSDWVSHAGLDP